MADASRRGITQLVLYLSGSAINSIKNAKGKTDSLLGAEAMRQAIWVRYNLLLQHTAQSGTNN